jgi:hypothetical protein
MKRSQKSAFTITLLLASLSLTACGGRAPGVTPDVLPTQPPSINPLPPVDTAPISQPPLTYPTDQFPGGNMPTQPSQVANPSLGQYEVDQDSFLNAWQGRGIAVSGGSIYIAAVDTRGLSKKGTIVKMDANTGKNWKNLGSSLLGLNHKMYDTLQGVALAGGNLFALDANKGMYSLSASGGNIKELKGTGGMDLAGSNNGIFVAANGMLERSDMSGMARAPINGIPALAGIGANSRGEVFFIANGRIGVLDLNGMPRDVIMQGLVNPLDVAGDGRTGDIYVLEQGGIKRFSMNGQLLSSFAHNAAQPTSIAIDESGNVYVSDFGTSNKDSKILKFGPPNGSGMGIPGSDPYATPGYGTTPGYGSGYGTAPAYGSGYGTTPGYGSGYGTTPGYGSGYGTAPAYGSGYGTAPAYGSGYGTTPSYGTAPAYGTYATQQGAAYAPAPQTATQGRRY